MIGCLRRENVERESGLMKTAWQEFRSLGQCYIVEDSERSIVCSITTRQPYLSATRTVQCFLAATRPVRGRQRRGARMAFCSSPRRERRGNLVGGFRRSEAVNSGNRRED